MQRETAINALKAHEAELKQLGVVSLYLFGSTARGEAREDSLRLFSGKTAPKPLWRGWTIAASLHRHFWMSNFSMRALIWLAQSENAELVTLDQQLAAAFAKTLI